MPKWESLAHFIKPPPPFPKKVPTEISDVDRAPELKDQAESETTYQLVNPKVGVLYSVFCRNYPRSDGTLLRSTVDQQECAIHKTSGDSFALKYVEGMVFKSHHIVVFNRDTKEIGRLPDAFVKRTWKSFIAKRGSGGFDLLSHGIFYVANLALAKADGIKGFYLHFTNEEGNVKQVVLLGDAQLVDNVISPRLDTPTYKSAQRLSNELLLIFQNEETRALYLSTFPDDPLLKGRYLYTSFIFMLVITLIVGQRCKNPSLPKTLAECHREFMKCWGDNSQEFLCSTFVIAISERFKLYEILHDYNGMDILIDRPDKWKASLSILIRSSLLIRGEMYNKELASLKASSPTSNVDLDKLFLVWATISHQFITGNDMPNNDANLHQETFHIICLKEALATYYNSIIDVFDDQ
jgi:hypothetical protein